MTKPRNFTGRKEQRRREADERAEARKGRTAEEQLALIDERPGNSTKEREKLSS